VIGGRLYIYVPCGPGYPGGRLLRYNPATDSYVWLPGPPVKHDGGGQELSMESSTLHPVVRRA
jgi:hypothetical protein